MKILMSYNKEKPYLGYNELRKEMGTSEKTTISENGRKIMTYNYLGLNFTFHNMRQ